MIELEICANAEWWSVHGPLGNPPPDRGQINDMRDNLVEALEDAGYEVRIARGIRSTCGGWNSYKRFRRKSWGIGTFDEVSVKEWHAIEKIASKVIHECGQG